MEDYSRLSFTVESGGEGVSSAGSDCRVRLEHSLRGWPQGRGGVTTPGAPV